MSSHPDGSGCEVTVNATVLLLSRLGPTKTAKSPEVAPVGIVMLIDVAFQELIVTGAPFRVTVLPPWEAPKPDPEITTWVPIGPVVVDSPVITGAGVVVELTDTLSNVAVDTAVRLDPLTPSPM
jgi:uncharacterized membrane protein YdfJ with MMPL/SSD domain